MTSSFGNLIGTERDRIPELPVSNYASTEANMEEAVNKQIDRNIADQERFFKELGDIEELKAQNFFDNLDQLSGLVTNVAKFREAREKNREARELLKFSNNLFDEKKEEFLEFQEKRADMTEAEQQSLLRELAGNDPRAFELLKMTFMPDTETLDNAEFKQKYNDFAISGFNNTIKKNNVFNLPTRLEAVNSIDNTIEDIVTKYLIDASAKGLNVNSRELRRYFNKQLFPTLRKAKEEALGTWNRISLNNLQKNQKAEAQSLIISTVNSKGRVVDANGKERIVYNGIYDDEEAGLIQLVQKKMGFQKPKQALDFIIETFYEKRYQIESGGISYFMNDAEFTNRATNKKSKGYLNAGIGSQGEIDGNMGYLTRIQSEMVLANDTVLKNIKLQSQERVREIRLQNLPEDEFRIKMAEEEALYRRKLDAAGLPSDIPLPNHFLTDETSGAGTASYSNQVGKANRIFDIVDVGKDFVNKLRAEKRDPLLELTSLQKNIQVKSAEYELTQNVNKRMAGDKNLTLEAALQLEYPKVLEKLLAGDYSAQVDITRPTLPIDIRNDRTFLKDNGIDATMSQKEFVSLDEKRALDELYDYYESGFKTPFPQYFREVTHGTNVMPHEYALARYKAMFPGDTSNMKNPETFFDLTEEEQRYLYLRKNQTKNLNLLNNDDNTEIEAKMLNALKVTDDSDYYRDPNSNPFTKPKVKLEEMTVADAYRKAKAGATDFGMYKISAQELVEVVEAGGIRVDGVMDEQTQNAIVFGLMRIQANKSNSIMGALIDADKDWRRLTNLSDAERTQVLQFFPNLRGMTNNQFQNLQGDINEIILDQIKKPTTNTEKFFDGLIRDYVENDFGGLTI